MGSSLNDCSSASYINNPPGQALADPQEKLERLGCLNRADDAGQHPKDGPPQHSWERDPEEEAWRRGTGSTGHRMA